MYRKAVNYFIEFRVKWDLSNVWPVGNMDIVALISHMNIEGFAPSTISTYISALSFVHKVNAWADPTSSFIVTKVKEGCRRGSCQGDSRRPITFPILVRLVDILPAICKSSYEEALFKAAILLAFFGFLRVSEFACTKKEAWSKVINVNDISLQKGQLGVVLRFSKTDQCGQSVKLLIDKSKDVKLCPVKAMSDWLNIRGEVLGPLFIHFGGDPLTSFQFGQVLKEGIKTIGLSPDYYSSHSLRIGAATSAALCGFSDERIKEMGRWKSAAFKVYIRPQHLVSFV